MHSLRRSSAREHSDGHAGNTDAESAAPVDYVTSSGGPIGFSADIPSGTKTVVIKLQGGTQDDTVTSSYYRCDVQL